MTFEPLHVPAGIQMFVISMTIVFTFMTWLHVIIWIAAKSSTARQK